MGGEGLDFSQLLQLSEDFSTLSKNLPKESQKFLRQQGSKLLQKTKRKAKQLVRTDHEKPAKYAKSPHYHDTLKRGKAYFYRSEKVYAIRVYSSAPHAHLLEYGHKIQSGGRVDGLHVFEKAGQEFERHFETACEDFMDEAVNKL